LQTALKRLEQKGYLSSHDGEATQERAGRPKRYFQITALGKKAMEYMRTTRNELWGAIPQVALDVKYVS
jgi:PadR family transcriptional regulator PadR